MLLLPLNPVWLQILEHLMNAVDKLILKIIRWQSFFKSVVLGYLLKQY